MKNFENELQKIKVPVLKDDHFEQELRQELEKKYFYPRNGYRLKFKFAIGTACLLAIFSFSTILYPKIALKINKFAFQKQKLFEKERIEETIQPEIDNMRYTSIYSPKLVDKVNPSEFKEDKAYVIRKYTSADQGSVMIVSEFKQKPQKTNKKISY